MTQNEKSLVPANLMELKLKFKGENKSLGIQFVVVIYFLNICELQIYSREKRKTNLKAFLLLVIVNMFKINL